MRRINELIRQIGERLGYPVELYVYGYVRDHHPRTRGWVKPDVYYDLGIDASKEKTIGQKRYGIFAAGIDPKNWRNHSQILTEFELSEFPGCCAFCISTGAWVSNEVRNKGINTIANQLRQEIARNFGYTTLICTDVTDNLPQRKVLAKNGFRDIYTVNNKRTGNNVNISIKEL